MKPNTRHFPGVRRMAGKARAFAGRFAQEAEVYRLVLKHRRTPRASRYFLGAALAYALTPIDVIPDFIPLVGHLDDLIILPLLIWLGVRLIPRDVIVECRASAAQRRTEREKGAPHPA